MIPITKDEAMMLREKNLGSFVKHTFSKKKHYYCVESERALRTLREYRKQRVVKYEEN